MGHSESYESLANLRDVLMTSCDNYSKFTGAKELITQLIPSQTSVLDIGCSSGVLGRELIRRKQCSMIGVELEAQAAAQAEKYYEKVFVGDLEKLFSLGSEYSETFDVVVFADVLEHLRSPSKVLAHFAEYASPEGIILISVPNVANWLNRLTLLMGRWEYRSSGILDRTHLKFYTYSTARRLVESCGLAIDRTVCTTGSRTIDLRLGVYGPANIWKGLLAFQFIFRCRRQQARVK